MVAYYCSPCTEPLLTIDQTNMDPHLLTMSINMQNHCDGSIFSLQYKGLTINIVAKGLNVIDYQPLATILN